jgi:hypothetical protein
MDLSSFVAPPLPHRYSAMNYKSGMLPSFVALTKKTRTYRAGRPVRDRNKVRYPELNTRGWACVTGITSQSELLDLARSIGRPVASPTGELVKQLTPTPQAHARRGTLSHTYATGSFPLHTDTAFWPVPSKYIVLRARGDIRRPTTILTFVDLFRKGASDLRALAERSIWLMRAPSKNSYCSMRFHHGDATGWTGDSQNGVTAYETCSGTYVDVSDYFFNSWSTANAAIATVNGTAVHHGVGVGSTTSHAHAYISSGYNRPCPSVYRSPSGGANVTPKVVQGNRTHVYIGSDSTVIQNNALFSQGTPSGGTYTWSTPDSTTSFDNVHAQDPHVKATNYTGKTNDTQLTVNYSFNGVAATPASIMVTKLIFERLCCDSVIQVNSYNGPTQYGHIFQASYNVIANPGSVQVADASGVSTSEQVTQTSSNYPLNPHTGAGALTQNSQLLDTLSLLNSTPIPSDVQIVDSQNWFVGGFYVRNNTLTYRATGVTVTNNGPTS